MVMTFMVHIPQSSPRATVTALQTLGSEYLVFSVKTAGGEFPNFNRRTVQRPGP